VKVDPDIELVLVTGISTVVDIYTAPPISATLSLKLQPEIYVKFVDVI